MPTIPFHLTGEALWRRMERAVEKVQERLERTARTLEALLRMKLNSFRDKDRMHVRDMIDVGLLDDTWCDRLAPELAARLKELLDNPNG